MKTYLVGLCLLLSICLNTLGEGFNNGGGPGTGGNTNNVNSAVTAGTATNAPDGNPIASTPAMTNYVTSVTSLMQTNIQAGVIYASAFGAKGDGKVLYAIQSRGTGVSITNGSTTLYCGQAMFTTNDIGKMIAYSSNTTNRTWTIITGILSTNQCTLQTAATNTAVNQIAYYGSTNNVAMQSAINSVLTNNNLAVKILCDSGIYMFWPTLQSNTVFNSILTIPWHAIDITSLDSQTMSVELDGLSDPLNVTYYQNYQEGSFLEGTIFYCPFTGSVKTGTNASFISGGMATSYTQYGPWSDTTFITKGITWRIPDAGALGGINMALGGNGKWSGKFDVDWLNADTNGMEPVWTNNIALWMPNGWNSSYCDAGDIVVNDWYMGVIGSEHSEIQHLNAMATKYPLIAYAGYGTTVRKLQTQGCQNPVVVNNENGNTMLLIESWQQETWQPDPAEGAWTYTSNTITCLTPNGGQAWVDIGSIVFGGAGTNQTFITGYQPTNGVPAGVIVRRATGFECPAQGYPFGLSVVSLNVGTAGANGAGAGGISLTNNANINMGLNGQIVFSSGGYTNSVPVDGGIAFTNIIGAGSPTRIFTAQGYNNRAYTFLNFSNNAYACSLEQGYLGAARLKTSINMQQDFGIGLQGGGIMLSGGSTTASQNAYLTADGNNNFQIDAVNTTVDGKLTVTNNFTVGTSVSAAPNGVVKLIGNGSGSTLIFTNDSSSTFESFSGYGNRAFLKVYTMNSDYDIVQDFVDNSGLSQLTFSMYPNTEWGVGQNYGGLRMGQNGSGGTMCYLTADYLSDMQVDAKNFWVNTTNATTFNALVNVGGFSSTQTNSLLLVSSTGTTNNTKFEYRLFGVTGVGVLQTNLSTGYGFSRGTISVPTDIILQTNECLSATSGFGVQGKQAF